MRSARAPERTSLTTAFLGSIATGFALFVIGTFSDDLRNFAAIAEGATKWLATGAAWVVPNFSSLNVILQAAHGQHIRGQLILFNTVYSLLYSAAAIALAVIIFERRNLK